MLNTFLQNYESVSSSSSGSDGFHSRSFKPCCSYPDVNKLVCELKVRLETIFNQEINETVQKGKTTKSYFHWLYLVVSLSDEISLNVLPVSDLAIKNHPVCIKVGDRVRVKPSIKTPKYGWGRGVTHKSVGVVKGKICSILININDRLCCKASQMSMCNTLIYMFFFQILKEIRVWSLTFLNVQAGKDFFQKWSQ